MKDQGSVRLVITGGHVTPALPIIDLARKAGWKIYWFGEKQALRDTSTKTLELRVIPKLNIPFFPVLAAKFHREAGIRSLFSSWRIAFGFLQSFFLLLRLSPSVVASFGSYVSVPVCLAAWMLGIPIVVHEQTAESGLANRFIAHLAFKVAISFPQSSREFPKSKIVLTGNPLRESIWKVAKERYKSKYKHKMPTLYITGGSRGSQIINQAVYAILPQLLGKFRVYHQTGELDFAKFANFKRRLHETLGKNYHICASWLPEEVDKIFLRADIVISRAGANTVGELAAVGIPAILVPIPWSESNEQTKNAGVLAGTGLAHVLPQADLSPGTLWGTIEEMFADLAKYQEARYRSRSLVEREAARLLFDLLEEAST